jgi:O-antigen ligase
VDLTLHVLELCIYLLAGALILLQSRRNRRLAVPGDVKLLLAALAVSLFISNAVVADPVYSLPRLNLYLSIGLLAVAIYLTYRDAVVPLHAFFAAIAVSHIPLLVEVLVWVGRSQPPFFRAVWSVPNFEQVRHFGTAAFFAAASGCGMVALSSRLRLLPLFLTFSALFGIIATGSRAPLLAWAGLVVLLTCFGPRRLRVAASGLVILTLALSSVWLLDRSGLFQSPSIFTRVEQSGDPQQFDSGRLVMWRAVAGVIAEHPWFGLGAEAQRLSRCCDVRLAHPHNFVLQLLMQFGLVGNALLAALGWRAVKGLGGLRQVWSLVFSSPENRVLACMLAAYFVLALVDGLLFFAIPMIHLALFAGLFAAGLHQALVGQPLLRDPWIPRP